NRFGCEKPEPTEGASPKRPTTTNRRTPRRWGLPLATSGDRYLAVDTGRAETSTRLATARAACWSSSGIRWLYLSRVKLTEACPRRRETILIFTPALRRWLECVWRRS